MRGILILLGIAALIVIALLALGMISFDQERSAQLPTVKIEGGQAPKFDVDVGRVDVTTTNKTLEVPTLQVEKAAPATPPAQ